MRSYPYVTGAATLLLVAGSAAAPATAADHSGFTLKDSRITESSGLAASRAHPGVYWTHNDQDAARIFAVDGRSGKTVATLTFTGVGKPRDMEAISVGPDGQIYIGDIGDNLNGSWDHVWIYSLPEPKTLRNATVQAKQYTVRYEDGARDAEALMIHPKTGRAYIASKNQNGGKLYEGPAKLSTSGNNIFREVQDDLPWVTDGAFSPDGKQLVLRSYFSARGYVWKDGRLGADHRVKVPIQGQSESVTYTADGSALLFGSEGQGSEVERIEVEGGDGGGKGSGGGSGSGGEGDGEGLVERNGFTNAVLGLGLLVLLYFGGRKLLSK
ncbi:TolB-like translocation protein [Streptomyces yaizuensis]|uniref:WD40 repeat domain-containing protein n=1 Tax=Streptomyces yaizuensis TaxID=2989713 RepID=A0ABQ5P3R2_9ACTN|nr:WD40 repeat domain-containing protein [Streptomyces sp. YSPA8]GLF97232.1 WD40 repeat domain-containing protein [Streptomyces sp. YSPA8]